MDFRELRKTYLSFMESRGYTRSEPDTLLAFEFPYTFTPSAAVNYYWKMIHTPEKQENPTSCQRVFRHWDVSKVGDGRHLSFFEMIGTWSFNGLYREHILKDHFEFMTHECGLDLKRIYATVFAGVKVYGNNIKNPTNNPLIKQFQRNGVEVEADQTARDVWRSFGIQNNNIIALGEEDCFLINTTEPFAAHRTELFYDLSPNTDSVTKEVFLAHPERFLEFFVSLHEKWIKHGMVEQNSLINPERDRNSFLQEVKPKIYPAGFGLERLTMILSQTNNVFAIEPYQSLNSMFSYFAPEIDHSMKYKIIDCIRGITFLVADGAGEIRRTENKQRVHIYREHLKRLISLMREVGCDRQEVYRALFQKAIELHCEHYPFLAGEPEPCLEEIEKQKLREVQEEKEQKKYQKHLQKRIIQ